MSKLSPKRLEDQIIATHTDEHGKKIFMPREGWCHFWPPVLLQIARIERIYKKSCQRIILRQKLDQIQKTIKRITGPHPKKDKKYILHCKTAKDWVRLTISLTPHFPYFHCQHTWLANKPNIVKKVKLGNALWGIFHGVKSSWPHKLKELLQDAVVAKLNRDQYSQKLGTRFEISINGRQYFYVYDYYHDGHVDYGFYHCSRDTGHKKLNYD